MDLPIETVGLDPGAGLGVLIFNSLESTLVLAVIVLVAFPLCGMLLGLIGRAGKKYYGVFFKTPGKLKIKFLKMEIDLQVAGIAFLFLSIVILLVVCYAFLRMVPGKS